MVSIKRYKFLLAVVLLGVAVHFFTKKENNSKTSLGEMMAANKRMKKVEGGINGALQYYAQLHGVDPNTGEFPLNAYYKSISDANNNTRKAQANKTGAELGLQWESLGPDNIGGRTRGFLIDKDNHARMYMGGVSGGLWYTNSSGSSWQPINDTFSSLAVTCIAQSKDGDIYFGTGESFGTLGGNNPSGGTMFPGEGVFRSKDGGNTFQNVLSPTDGNNVNDDLAFINDIITDPNNNNIVFVAAEGGVFKSEDGGESFTKMQGGVLPAGVTDLKISGDGGLILAASGGAVRRSTDGGENFENLSGNPGYPTATAARTEVAISPQDPNYIYMYTSNNSGQLGGIYQSKDMGNTWEEIGSGAEPSTFNPPGTQGRYNLCIAVSPLDKGRIYVGGNFAVYTWDSLMGWAQISSWIPFYYPGQENTPPSIYVHADHHNIFFHPTDGNTMFVVTDGGVFRTNNALSEAPAFKYLNRNYNVTQYYGMAAAITGEVIGGTQDNGTHYIDYNGISLKQGAVVGYGDGGYCAISKLNPDVIILESQYAAIRRSSNGGDDFENPGAMYDQHIDCDFNAAQGGCNPDGIPDPGETAVPFITKYKLWEDLDDSLHLFYMGTRKFWVAKHVLFLNSNSPIWFQLDDLVGNTVTAMSFSKDGNVVYYGTSNGRVSRIVGMRDAILDYEDPATWNATMDTTKDTMDFALPYDSIDVIVDTTYDSIWHVANAGIYIEKNVFNAGGYVSSISVDQNDASRVVVTTAGYTPGAHVYLATNAADTSQAPNFASIQGNVTTGLPAMPVYSSVIDIADGNRIILGTELGIWTTDNPNGLVEWTEENNGMARVPTYHVIQEPIIFEDNDVDLSDNCYFVYAATHGRGMYRTKSLTTEFCKTNITLNVKQDRPSLGFNLYPNPVKNQGFIEYDLENSGDVTLNVLDVTGKLVSSRNLGTQSVGSQKATFDVSNLNSGTYIMVLVAGNQRMVEKVIVQ